MSDYPEGFLPKKICVVGAGAIGALLAVGFAERKDLEVSVIARGAHLAAIQKNGLTVIRHEGKSEQRVVAKNIKATSVLKSLGKQDVIFLAVKGHQIHPFAEELEMVSHEHTVFIPLQNGIPWWYFFKNPHPGSKKFQNHILRSVDPDGLLSKKINIDRVIGCISFPAAFISEPGVITHVEGDRFPLGELDGKTTRRLQTISELMTECRFKAFTLPDIRSEIWLKMWGNLPLNPISALSHATLKELLHFDLTRQLTREMMQEAQVVAEKLGAKFRLSMDKRLELAATLDHKTSMLQDVEAGRELEVAPLIASVVELAELTSTPIPHIRSIFAVTSLLSRGIQTHRVAFLPSKI